MPLPSDSFPLDTGVRIPSTGFGTYPIPNGEVGEVVRQAIATGYRHVDTAEKYGNEEGVGAGIRKALADGSVLRDDLFVTTKLWPVSDEGDGRPKSRTASISAFEESLGKLGLDYVDLYLIHSPHAGEGRLEQWEALLDLKRSGRVRAVGVSNYGQPHIEEIVAAGLELPVVNQIELHPWSQYRELVAYLRRRGIRPVAFSSLAPLSTWRPDEGVERTQDMKADGEVFAAMAAKYGVGEAQLLLRWGLQNGYVVVPKSTNPERMRQNLDLGGFTIDAADMATMEAMERGKGFAWPDGDPTQAA